MTSHVSHTRPAVAGRRAGYAVAIAVNLVLLYLVNVAPGWQAVPFLTESTTEVLNSHNERSPRLAIAVLDAER